MPATRTLVRLLALAATLALAVPTAAPAAPVVAPAVPQQGPDPQPETAPDVRMEVFKDEVYSYSEGVRTKKIYPPAPPAGASAWDRIILQFDSRTAGDPWDRLYGVGISGVELMRGTTPRWTFSVRKDVTEFATLLPPGVLTDVQLTLGSWVGALMASVTLEFYAHEPTAEDVRPAAAAVRGAFEWRSLNGNGQRLTTSVAFPATAPARAAVEVTLSGHGGALLGTSGSEEFWYTSARPLPRVFHVMVDGAEIAQAVAMPYVYALAGGSDGGYINQSWWMVFGQADGAGLHTGVGEIPPYRADITDPEALALLAGARTVELVQQNGYSTWVSSLSFLLGTA